MQPRRHEDLITQSPASAKVRNPQFELGAEQYLISRKEEQSSIRSKGSLSPRLDGPQRIVSGDRRRASIERRDYDWQLSGGGGRSERVRSRSPLYEQVRKRPQFDEGKRAQFDEGVMRTNRSSPPLELRRRYQVSESMDFNHDGNLFHGLKNAHGYNLSTSRISKDKDYDGSRLSASDGHGMLVQKSGAMEDGTVRGLFRLPQEVGPSNYEETGEDLSSMPGNFGIGRFEDERLRYRNPLSTNKLLVTESFREGEKPSFYLTTSQIKDFASTSSGISRSDVPASYRDVHLPTDDFSRNFGKPIEPLGVHGYSQRPLLDSTRDSDADPRDLIDYRRDARSPAKNERRDYHYSKIEVRESDDICYPSNEIYRKLPSHTRADYAHRDMPPRAQLDYDHIDMPLQARVDYDHRDIPLHARVEHHHKDSLRSSIMDFAADSIDNAEGSRGNLRKSSLWNHSLQEQTVSNYPDMRTSYASKQGGEYVGSGNTRVEFGRKMSRDYEIPPLNVSRDHEMSHMRVDYGFGRDAGPGSQKEGFKGSSVPKYDAERHRLAIRRQRMEAEELGIHDPSGRILKRKYSVDEETSRYNSRSIISSKWNMPSGSRYLNDGSEEWIDEDMSDLYSSRTMRFDQHQYRKADRMFDERDHHRDFSYDDWLSSQDPFERVHALARLSESDKPARRYIKGHPGSASLSWYNSYHLNRRSDFQKQHKVWKRNTDDHHMDVHADDVDPSQDPSEDWLENSEPPEETEEFKELVHRAFLKFSKKLNESMVVRRRYTEQGKAGSLFCIVCGRSLSKEFMDTQRLVTHAFMSHKIGLRAQHLGLHKAICVLLGWNSIVARDTITYVPQVLPDAEALAQKEDLMLWPPLIIIHNSSLLNDNPEERKVVTIEELGSFLRGKGFVGGRFKVCLGKPANRSIMVVKFLGTFPGLQDAERLHKYYAENKHGKADFEQVTSHPGKNSNSGEAGMQQGDKVEELVLYGYMGIADDLDKLDFDTKRRCLIKSKKEIQDLANDPVKPDER
ncbi:hypothetical protein L1049_011299 [Liquidambar formosana]|uniref:XS domain-containing protein n=1 Tax=Liquidambar formosana TaxID=63359 RepID=A0AAP0RXK1_LIQFO